MIIRVVLKNIYSFKNQTEFNLLPNRSTKLSHHRVKEKGINFLRYSAIYGANGSGKSNLIKSISLLEDMIDTGELIPNVNDYKFKLDKSSHETPISIGVEFVANKTPLYYTLTFDQGKILHEYLAESNKKDDILIFERNFNGKNSDVKFSDSFYEDEENVLFTKLLSDKLISNKELLISYLGKKFKKELPVVNNAYEWFNSTLVIIKPNTKPGGIAHTLDTHKDMRSFATSFLSSVNTGIRKIEIEKKRIDEKFGKKFESEQKQYIDKLIQNPEIISTLTNEETGDEISVTYENDEVVTRSLLLKHQNDKNEFVDFTLRNESDGTKRLIDYIPALRGVINNNKVYLIDEIERSIHPLLIKEIVKKLTLNKHVVGQLIFTTHESHLLDQKILRTDEIWFVQKDIDGSSKLYTLSDFKIHNTIDIENGYLNGRYGGIPFLANFEQLNW